ncbi:phage major tail tube protein, partial [uncultured Cetobacterium sp.]
MSIPALIQECSVKIEGNEKILGIASFKMPEISFKEEEINVLGLGAHKEVLIGQPEAMATTIKFLGLDKAALKLKTGKRINLVL